MDLTSITAERSGHPPGAYENYDVETRVAFDENGRPYYVTVPAPSRVPDRVPQRYNPEPVRPAPGQTVVYQPVQPYYAPSGAPAPYSPVRDPIVWRLLTGGASLVAGAWALSFALAALVAAEAAIGLLLALAVVVWLMSSGRGSGRDRSVTVNITNSNRSRHRN